MGGWRRWAISAAIALLSSLHAVALGAAEFGHSETWEYELAAYGWFSGVNGNATVQGTSFPIDLGSPEFWRVLNLSFNFGLEAHRGPWALVVDAAIANTEDDVTLPGGGPGTFRIENVLPGAAVSYRLLAGSATRLEGLAGVRYSELELVATADTLQATATEKWLDPIVGLRVRGRLAERVFYRLRGDVGGFGAGSELTWNGIVVVVYETSAHFQLGLGYRYYETEFESGAGTDRFVYDARQHGPLAGLIVLF